MPLWNHPMWATQWGVVVAASVAAAAFDLRRRRVPNFITGPLVLSGLIAASWMGGWPGLLESLGACLLLAAPYVLLFMFAGGGAGDAKLMGGVGAWLGLLNGVIALASVAMAGALLAIVFAIVGRRASVMVRHLNAMATGLLQFASGRGGMDNVKLMMPQTKQMQTMPYGVAICLGVCLAALGAFLCRV